MYEPVYMMQDVVQQAPDDVKIIKVIKPDWKYGFLNTKTIRH